ncbi:transporter [Bradyrhizobium canariense]|uniref:Putative MetA-pathway of phenol degradation n=1 Tax=Bradyrhizobium canariense TaxID=255045 RepID=A0A1H1UGZ2_9BRAD|nr:transporter [Bradyrhizobium canariense]SDS71772.1 Putative MetA-pathway of phenol degradation [Bradyrhizobium canariense]
MATGCIRLVRLGMCAGFVLALLTRAAVAGPPYVSDDPEPTDYKHFEIYTFNNGTTTRDGTTGESGIDFNYGAAPDLQLTATLPAGFDLPAGGGTNVGLSNIELAAKYRFLHQDGFGLDVSVFPRIFLPSGSNSVGDNRASLLLPIWVQKDWSGGWSAFGGGGCTVSEFRAVDFCQAGAVLTYQILPKLQIGAELFHQTADSNGTPATTSVGIGWRYDLNDNYHLLGYVRRGIENTNETDQYSWYASVLFTF